MYSLTIKKYRELFMKSHPGVTVHYQTVLNWCHTGKIKAKKIMGRWYIDATFKED